MRNLDELFDVFDEARSLTGHKDYVVIGSLSILGLENKVDIPDEMAMSNDIDCYTKNDPGRISDVITALGEHSAYHKKHGYYLDAASPNLPSLPDGWENRLNKVERNGVQLWFLDPNDASQNAGADPPFVIFFTTRILGYCGVTTHCKGPSP